MIDPWLNKFEKKLQVQKGELEQRIARIRANHRRPLDRDSTERATQLENQEVVDALGKESLLELDQTIAALAKIKANEYGICEECSDPIREQRLLAYPHAEKCIDCASLEARGRSRHQVSGQ